MSTHQWLFPGWVTRSPRSRDKRQTAGRGHGMGKVGGTVVEDRGMDYGGGSMVAEGKGKGDAGGTVAEERQGFELQV